MALSLPAVLLLALGVMCALMIVLWAWQRAHRDAGIVDAGWAFGLGLLALVYAATRPAPGARTALVAAVAVLWSWRLAWHLLTDRVIGKPEDGRYQTLRAQWAPHEQRAFFVFFQAQAVAAVLFSLPMLMSMLATRPLGAWDFAALAVWLTAFIGEVTADTQLAAWRSDGANRGRTCRKGLWAWSRHPNYFFEWLYWWTYVLFSVHAPHGALTVIAPMVMLFLLFRVTGIPATEARALLSRGDDYRDYQRTTSVFFPLPPKARA
jgi:steroid 5-alpha reductase family enzyme